MEPHIASNSLEASLSYPPSPPNGSVGRGCGLFLIGSSCPTSQMYIFCHVLGNQLAKKFDKRITL
jgi:hypothetical protein